MLHAFLQVSEGRQQRVDISLSSQNQRQAHSNRIFLTSIIKCLKLCGRQGIALRGHRDDSTSVTLNQGNFKALLDLRIDAGDVALDNHLKTCAKHSTYISKTTQNELLDCMREIFQKSLTDDVRYQSDVSPGYFGIQANEVVDASNSEQLGIILRYLKKGNPIEKLVVFVEGESITGSAICDKILKFLKFKSRALQSSNI